ncbi:TBC1D2, partial [Symbiodinium natans]
MYFFLSYFISFFPFCPFVPSFFRSFVPFFLSFFCYLFIPHRKSLVCHVFCIYDELQEVHLRKLPSPGDWSSIPKNTLKALLRKGVPHEHRPELWWSILGCEAERLRSPVSFQQYLEEPVETETAETIERDLPRTFPTHQKFRCAAGRAELRNVLRAFSRRCPAVRYCQGMNFIAALLLVVSQDEERAFWMFVCAFDALGVEGYYTEGMTLLRADMQVLASCMQAKCAKVSRTLNQFNVDLLAICSEWYITWFAKSLPVSTVLRVWDALFFEGFKVLFRVSMGIFKQIEQEVLKSDGFDAIMQQAKCWPRSIVEHNELMKASFQGLPYFKRQQLRKAREQALCRIEKEDQDRVRIGDFGIACAVKAPHKAVLEGNVVGTPYYMSPETCSMGLHSYASDVWAMGCVLYELSALKLPYYGDTLEELMAEITRKAAPRFPITYSAELAQIYAAVLSHNRNKRPSASDVLFMQPLHQTLEALLQESQKAKKEKIPTRPASAPPEKKTRAAASEAMQAAEGDTIYPSLDAAPDEGDAAQMPGTAAPFRRLQELRRNAGTPLP